MDFSEHSMSRSKKLFLQDRINCLINVNIWASNHYQKPDIWKDQPSIKAENVSAAFFFFFVIQFPHVIPWKSKKSNWTRNFPCQASSR